MKLLVPIEKDSDFAVELFNTISRYIFELRDETGKVPDQISFNGPLGKEVHSFICEKNWNLKKFKLFCANSTLNEMIFCYSKPLDQIEEMGATIFDESFNNRQISGIPSGETMQKILSKYSSPAFKIERKIQPKIEIQLIRKK